MPFYLSHEQDDFNQIPERQVCIAEALYDAEAVLSNPSAFKPEEIRTLRDQIVSNLERAWEITGGSEDELTGDDDADLTGGGNSELPTKLPTNCTV